MLSSLSLPSPFYHNTWIMPLLVWTADWQIQLARAPVELPTGVLKPIIRTPCPASQPQHFLTTCPPRSLPWQPIRGQESSLAWTPPQHHPPAHHDPEAAPLPHKPLVNTPKWTQAIWFASKSRYFPHFSLMSTPYSESEGKNKHNITFPLQFQK